MKFTLDLALGNEAMQSIADIAGALRITARQMLDGAAEYDEQVAPLEDKDADQGRIYDDNGNHVGAWHIWQDNPRTKWSDVDTMPPSMIDTPISNITERAAVRDYAFHSDGEPCVRAMLTQDCPLSHLYGRTFETAY